MILKRIVLLAVLATACSSAAAEPVRVAAIPPYLVGEWASEDAEFRGAGLASGTAVYVDADGTGAVLGAPPPIGVRFVARFDFSAAMLTATLFGDGGETMGQQRFHYDAPARTLQMLDLDEGTATLRRRKDSVPPHIREMIAEAARQSRKGR